MGLAVSSAVMTWAASVLLASTPAPGTLEALVAESWAQSPEVARAEAEVADASSEVTRLGVVLPNPQLQLSATSDALTQAEGEFDGDIGLVQQLVWPGARLARRDGAARAVEAARLRLALARLGVAARVEVAVAALRAASDAEALRADMARLAHALAEAAVRRAQLGATGSVEATLARADEALAHAAHADARAAVSSSEAALCALLGRTGCADVQVGWPELVALPTPPPVEARADVAAATLEVEAARRAVQGAEQDRIPTATLGVGFTVERTVLDAQSEPDGHIEDEDQLATVSLSVPLPVWDWKAGEIAAAKADVRRAEAQLAAQRRAAAVTVIAALARLEAATEAEARLMAVDTDVAAALTDVERAATAGGISLDVALTTRDRLLRTRLERVDARRRRVEAHAAALEAFADPRLVGVEVTP